MMTIRHALHMSETTKMTAQAYEKLQVDIEALEGEKRRELAERIGIAREWGDLKENAEYHAARQEQGLNELRISVLEHHIANAEVVDTPAAGGEAEVGSRVTYRDQSTGSETEVTLVHPLEASVPEGKLSVDSPVAKALLGSSAGDKVAFATPRGKKQLEILVVG